MMRKVKRALAGVPIIGPAAKAAYQRIVPPTVRPFEGSVAYWESRYDAGGNSGAGSYNRLATFKAKILNRFVQEHSVLSVIEFGSGDGAQLLMAEYPSYIGVDVSPTAVAHCKKLFADDGSKTFHLAGEAAAGLKAELSLSLDVIYHLVEDEVFERYMQGLFAAAEKYVAIYASNENKSWISSHVRHRRFSDWIDANQPAWALIEHVPNEFPYDAKDPDNTSFADFYIYQKKLASN